MLTKHNNRDVLALCNCQFTSRFKILMKQTQDVQISLFKFHLEFNLGYQPSEFVSSTNFELLPQFADICCKVFFLNVGPPKESIFLDHLLWSIFQSSIHNHYKLHFFMLVCQSAEYILELYICIKIPTIPLLIFTEKFSPLLGFVPGTSPVPSLYATN